MPDSGHSQPSGKGANRESPGPGVIRASKIEYIDRFSGAGHPVSMRSSQPPSQNVDAFDVVGERQEGGVDLIVSCSGPLDSSPGSLQLIERKVGAYLVTIAHANFARTYRAPERGPVRIFVSCEHFVSEAAQVMIDALAVKAAKQGVALLLVKSMASQSN
jgi:hypothetical protein